MLLLGRDVYLRQNNDTREVSTSRFARRLQYSVNSTGVEAPASLSTLIASAPPSGVGPAPIGPLAGTIGEFDASTLATNEVWDNFNGTTLDDRLWQRDTINQGGTQIYQDANMYLDGSSHAVMQCTQSGGQIYSGRFTSRQRFAMQYGWFAARIKMPLSTGGVGAAWFPAFWVLLVDYNVSSNYAEIDIMEQFGDSTTYSTHLYCSDGNPSNDVNSYEDVPASHSSDASQDYHTYWMLREPNRIRIGVDQLQMGDWSPADFSAGAWAAHMQQPMYYILNFAAAPNWLPAPKPTDFPAQMLVDWVWYKPLSEL